MYDKFNHPLSSELSPVPPPFPPVPLPPVEVFLAIDAVLEPIQVNATSIPPSIIV